MRRIGSRLPLRPPESSCQAEGAGRIASQGSRGNSGLARPNYDTGRLCHVRLSVPIRDEDATRMSDATVERARKLLETCALFRALDERARHDLAAHALPRTYAANEPIFHVGDPAYSMMGVVIGTVRILLPTPKGREIILADLVAGELFGEIALLDGKPRSASATALTNCELLILERRDVLPFLKRSSTACLNLMQILCDRIRRSDERMAEIAFFDLPVRLARVLMRCAPQGHGRSKISLSQRELAEMAGATRENVNRCLREWQRSGILELKDRWTIILKPEALRALEELS
jgi:CRP/FNR family transcriptional regulator, cyclic AMP receptor protein